VIIYLDILWFLNFLFNSLLLILTGLILKRGMKKRRIAAGAFFGSLLIPAAFTPLAPIVLSVPAKVLTSAFMVWAAFGARRLRTFFTEWGLFYVCAFAAGGALFGIHYFLHFNGVSFPVSSGFWQFGYPIGWLFVLAGFPIVLFFIKRSMNRMENMKLQTGQLVDVLIDINGKQAKLVGLVDSGNLLFDPLTGKPVMIASLAHSSHLFPESLLPAFSEIERFPEITAVIGDRWLGRFSVVPYRSVGQDTRVILAVRPDRVEIRQGEKRFCPPDPLVAFIKQELSSDGFFDCIVHPKMVADGDARKIS